ncbi:MAG TPA: hypothetical protein VIX89_03645 [Bryobacteraceae bacterium]
MESITQLENPAEQPEVETASTYALKPGVLILPFDSSTRHATHQVIGAGRRIAVNGAGAALFEFLRTPRTGAEVEEYASGRGLKSGPPIRDVLTRPPYSHFVTNAAPGEEPATAAPNQPAPKQSMPWLFVRFQILPARAVAIMARWFEGLFASRGAAAALLSIVAAHLYLFLSGDYSHRYAGTLTSNQWLTVVGGVYAALLFHELGHAAACSRFGSRVGGIGFGLYMIWPVLYADVSDSWLLPRRQRAIVDLSGIYFHLLVSSASVALAAVTHNGAFVVISKSIILATIINLNPFLRFDGYWLLTDVTGIPNIGKAMSQFWRYMLKRVSGPRGPVAVPELLCIPRHLQALFAVYCVATLWFFGYLLLRISYAVPRLVATTPQRFREFWLAATLNPTALTTLKSALLLLLFLAGILQMSLFFWRRLTQGYFALGSAAKHFRKQSETE